MDERISKKQNKEELVTFKHLMLSDEERISWTDTTIPRFISNDIHYRYYVHTFPKASPAFLPLSSPLPSNEFHVYINYACFHLLFLIVFILL